MEAIHLQIGFCNLNDTGNGCGKVRPDGVFFYYVVESLVGLVENYGSLIRTTQFQLTASHSSL